MNAQMGERREFVAWGQLAAPIFPDETMAIMRAQSILSGPDLGQCPPLTIEQARDVLAWHKGVA
jgi:hypothetical protein